MTDHLATFQIFTDQTFRYIRDPATRKDCLTGYAQAIRGHQTSKIIQTLATFSQTTSNKLTRATPLFTSKQAQLQ